MQKNGLGVFVALFFLLSSSYGYAAVGGVKLNPTTDINLKYQGSIHNNLSNSMDTTVKKNSLK